MAKTRRPKKTLTMEGAKRRRRENRKILREVWAGTRKRTKGGLTKSDLMKNPRSGKIVSKKKYAQGVKAMKRMKSMGQRAAPASASKMKRIRSRRA